MLMVGVDADADGDDQLLGGGPWVLTVRDLHDVDDKGG